MLICRACADCRGSSTTVDFGLVSAPLQARVTRVEIESRTDVLGGKSFGDVGPYERLVGQIFFSARVDNPHNSRIVTCATL